MKKSIPFILTILVTIFYSAGFLYAQTCEEGEAILSKTLASQPDEMTEQYIQTAIQFCNKKTSIYKEAAGYYEKWYKKEINPEKQTLYKKRAEQYYKKVISSCSNDKKAEIALSKLENSSEFNEAAFRSLKPVPIGSEVSGLGLKIHFMTDSYDLSNKVQEHLDILGGVLAGDESIKICLDGHTDIRGNAEYNNELSLKRADSVRDYIINKYNVSQDRILVKGYGYNRLIELDNPYSEKNRRVEVKKISE